MGCLTSWALGLAAGRQLPAAGWPRTQRLVTGFPDRGPAQAGRGGPVADRDGAAVQLAEQFSGLFGWRLAGITGAGQAHDGGAGAEGRAGVAMSLAGGVASGR